MKTAIYSIMMLFALLSTTSCSDDAWGNEGEADKQHWYFFGFQEWNNKGNDLTKNLANGETLIIPMQFWSERPQQGIHAEVEYYLVSDMKLGEDYQVTDEAGNALTPEANGGYKMMWPNCTKGIQNIYLKALSANKGKVVVQTWDPARTGDDKISTTNTVIIDRGSYKVSAFSTNYKLTVNVN